MNNMIYFSYLKQVVLTLKKVMRPSLYFYLEGKILTEDFLENFFLYIPFK